MTANYQAELDKLARLIAASQRLVVFTGAGVSTESGIPDFRGPDGIWTRFNPADFTLQKFLTSPETRRMSWERFRTNPTLDAQPNAAHYAIVEMERLGKLDCIITQNVDNLHQRAGNSEDKVIELHGTLKWVICLECGLRYPSQEVRRWLEEGETVPSCRECGGLLKSATVSFGQAMPQRETAEAERRSRLCDLFLVVGSSLVVYPAASMPRYALEADAKLAIINLQPTHLDHYADTVIRARAGGVLPLVVAGVRSIQEHPPR
ncbi:MAG: Sir2 family NAD-dependent protein deacetylase [Chloroflexi bacterium]|nr:Sir2 family NAD-dependent protein deacetylase [Chloroflexota bacterium]